MSTISLSRILEITWKAKIGSMLEEQPAMREIVPVGAMVSTAALRIVWPL